MMLETKKTLRNKEILSIAIFSEKILQKGVNKQI